MKITITVQIIVGVLFMCFSIIFNTYFNSRKRDMTFILIKDYIILISVLLLGFNIFLDNVGIVIGMSITLLIYFFTCEIIEREENKGI